MVDEGGLVKVLDFGLAKLTERPQIGEEESTRSIPPWTEEGTILGTAAYMSPEQAAGKQMDARSDIFNFGSVLYEMVTGQRAFQGDSKMSTLAAVLNQEPKPASEISRSVPHDLERIITRCLRKDPSRRFQHMDDLRVELDELLQTQPDSASQADSTPKGIKRHKPLAWMFTAILLAGIFFAAVHFRRPTAELQSINLSLVLPENARLDSHVISPDGSQLAFAATVGDKTQLWVRPLHSPSIRPLGGTEGARYPFWSPDGRFIGFFTQDKLKKVAVASGTTTSLCDVAEPRGGTWNRDGEIVFAPRISDAPLYRVSESGGDSVPVTTLDRSRQEDTHRWPWFLPDGRHFLYFVRSSQRDQGGIYVGSLDSRERRRLLGANGGMAYAEPGYLLYVQNRTLVAEPFDPTRLQTTGEPFSVLERVGQGHAFSRAFSVSRTNVLTYRREVDIGTRLVWCDRTGKQLQSIAAPDEYEIFSLSPDGSRLAGNNVDPETATGDIWLFELTRGALRRFTAILRTSIFRFGLRMELELFSRLIVKATWIFI
jgi:hypothetical protein